MKEDIKLKHANDASAFTEDELESYHELLKSAYPSPKRSIKDSVMAEIRSESKVLDVADSRKKKNKNKRMRLLVKYGSLAACLAVVTLVGAKLIPNYSLMTADTVGNEAVRMIEGAFETCAVAADEDAVKNNVLVKNYAMTLFATPAYGSAVIEDEVCEKYSDEAEAADDEIEYGVAADSAAPTAEEAVVEEVVEEEIENERSAIYLMNTVPMNSSYTYYIYTPVTGCEHSNVFRNSYHDIPKNLIALVGKEDFNRWAFETTESSRREVNMVEFYRHFSKDNRKFVSAFRAFAEGDGAYYCDIPDVDLFENGEWDKITEYYNNGGEYDKCVGNFFEYRYKNALVAEITVSEYTKWLNKNGMLYLSDWSISDIAHDFGITAERLSEIYDVVYEKFIKEYTDAELFTYDFDLLASQIRAEYTDGLVRDIAQRIY